MATTSITGVGTISSAGLGSGLDVSTIISSLMAVESRPLDMLKTQATSINSKISTFGKVQSYFSTLRDKANALSDSPTWALTTASSADSSAMKVSAGPSSPAGSYAVQVQKLASNQSVVSGSFAAADSQLNFGTLSIELGTWTGDPTVTGFTPKSGSSAVNISIAEGETSLTQIRDKINAAGAGVVASIVNDATGARLSIRSKDTGEENGFRITATESFDDGDDATGLSALGFDRLGPSQMTHTQAASSALVKINGIDVKSASNTLTDVVDGLSLTLMKTTATPVDVTVAPDTATIKKKIEEFVSAYNDLSNYLRTQSAYDTTTKTGGPLQGDSAATGLSSQLRSVLNQANTASSTWSRLSQVGITMNKDGTLAVDSSRLDNAMGNLPELKKLLATDGADAAGTGFIRRYKELADAALASTGTFYSRNESLKAQLERNTDRQDEMQRRLDVTEARLRKQYTALDATMATLSGLSSYVSQQMAALSKTSSDS
jgi:flagellar hook-associated protein 2